MKHRLTILAQAKLGHLQPWCSDLCQLRVKERTLYPLENDVQKAVRKLVLALRTTRIHPSLKRSLKARIPESSVEPAPLLLARKTLDNNTRSHSREDILRLYGVGVNSQVPVVDLPVRLDADEDEPAETEAPNVPLEMLTPDGLTRLNGDGCRGVAEMRPGPEEFSSQHISCVCKERLCLKRPASCFMSRQPCVVLWDKRQNHRSQAQKRRQETDLAVQAPGDG